jgi:DNA-binding transcriptional LysR family regulator
LTINLVYLETFLAVCTYGNFTEAAKHLYVPQPTVTNRIQHLEDELGQPLFVRGKAGKRNVQLTNAGDVFLPYAKQVLTSLTAAKKQVIACSQKNLIKIGSSIPFTHPFIVDKIKKLYTIDSEVNIELSFIKTSSLSHCLIDNTIDLAFSIETYTEENFANYTLGSEEFQLVLSPDHPLAVHSYIEDLTSIQTESLICYEPYMEHMEKNILVTYPFKKKLFSNQLGIIKNLLKQNYGIAFLPPLLLTSELKSRSLIALPIKGRVSPGEIQYSLIYKENHPIYKNILCTH